MTTPKTPAQRVAESRRRALEAGWRRLSNLYLTPEAAHALDALLAAGYASNATQVVATALLDAWDAHSFKSRI